VRILHVTPYMHPSAGGPPVVVENFVRETRRLGYLSKIISTPLFCNGDERGLLQGLNELAPTTFLSGTRTFPFLRVPTWRQFSESVCAADIVWAYENSEALASEFLERFPEHAVGGSFSFWGACISKRGWIES